MRFHLGKSGERFPLARVVVMVKLGGRKVSVKDTAPRTPTKGLQGGEV